MTNASIKIVRPWPAEQPRPPMTHWTESIKASTPPAAGCRRAAAVTDETDCGLGSSLTV